MHRIGRGLNMSIVCVNNKTQVQTWRKFLREVECGWVIIEVINAVKKKTINSIIFFVYVHSYYEEVVKEFLLFMLLNKYFWVLVCKTLYFSNIVFVFLFIKEGSWIWFLDSRFHLTMKEYVLLLIFSRIRLLI